MSMVTGILELTDAECKRGQLTPRPPIQYVKSKAGLLVQASRDTIKLKTLEGESKQALLCNNPDTEDFIVCNTFFTCHLEKTGVEDKLKKATELAESMSASLRKLLQVAVKEKDDDKAKCFESVRVTKEDLVMVKANVAAQVGIAYDLYRKLLTGDPEAHWDQIMSDMHTKDPWTDLIGVKHKCDRLMTQESPSRSASNSTSSQSSV
jgi:hypothetical protein